MSTAVRLLHGIRIIVCLNAMLLGSSVRPFTSDPTASVTEHEFFFVLSSKLIMRFI